MAENIESEIQAKGLVAPRVTLADVEANIASEYYFSAGDGVCGAALADGRSNVVYEQELGLLTFCVLVLRNGYTVTGESACASPENFDAELGCKIARQNAINKTRPLMGYALKCKLTEARHYSDCSTNNRGVPELLGPCDCGGDAPAIPHDPADALVTLER